MIIVMPVDENQTKTNVCVSFGRAPYFLVYDTENPEQKASFVENTAASQRGGAGIKAAQTILDLKAGVLLTPRCGENAADVLKSGGVALYQTFAGSAGDNIQAFLEGKLPPLGNIHPGFHGGE